MTGRYGPDLASDGRRTSRIHRLIKKYTVIVEGRNIYLDRGHIEKVGLFTTRRVEAADIREAEELAIELVKEELKERQLLRNPEDEPPLYLIDKIWEVDSFEDESVPERGFTFYEIAQ